MLVISSTHNSPMAKSTEVPILHFNGICNIEMQKMGRIKIAKSDTTLISPEGDRVVTTPWYLRLKEFLSWNASEYSHEEVHGVVKPIQPNDC